MSYKLFFFIFKFITFLKNYINLYRKIIMIYIKNKNKLIAFD